MIVVVDYLKGNLLSVARALDAAGVQARISRDADVIAQADAIVLPGVGAFADAAHTMKELGQTEAIGAALARGVAFLGICLGEHLMFDGGEEHAEGDAPTQGLGMVPGVVSALPRTDAAGVPYKIPHVGWNTVEYTCACPLFDGIPDGTHFYFTHSFAAPENPTTVAVTNHSVSFPSAIQRDACFGVQFHPEKSSSAGEKLLANFVAYARKV